MMNRNKTMWIVLICIVWPLMNTTYAETIDLYPVDAATISGIPDAADLESTPEPRVFLKFDLSGIRPGTKIDYAELKIGEVQLPQNMSYVGLIVSRVLHDWNGSDISWDDPGTDSDWEQPGGDWDEERFMYGAAGLNLMRAPFFNVTSIVREWISGDGLAPNYGFMLMLTEDTQDTESFVQILDVKRLNPVLRIEFTN